MKVLAAGIGTAFFRGHLPALERLEARRQVQLVACADVSPERRDLAQTVKPGVRLFASADEMLDQVDGDLLIVASPPSTQHRLARVGLGRGLAVLCEKPAVIGGREYEELDAALVTKPPPSLIATYQYRYAPEWLLFAKVLRAAVRSGEAFTMGVAVERPGHDPLAMGAWRQDRAHGGALGDHACHFLSLAWSVEPNMAAVDASRTVGPGGAERLHAETRLGCGHLTVRVSYAGLERSTTMYLETRHGVIEWRDNRLLLEQCGTAHRIPVRSLSDRSYVDLLYQPLYEDMLRNMADVHWRGRRTRELMEVGRLLVDLQAAADGQPRIADSSATRA